MPEIIISQDLIELGLDVKTKEAAIEALSEKLLARGYVKEDYCENVLRREQEFPTGLPTAIPVALCHTEAEHVNQSALSVGVLTHPVEFREMGTPERNVKAEIIFLLALNDPKAQVPWLKRMVTVFKSKETLEAIKSCKDKKELEDLLKSVFL